MIFSKQQFDSISEEYRKKIIESGGIITKSGGVVFNESQIVREQHNPNFPKKIKNFAGSMTRWACGGFKKVGQDVYDKRMGICNECQFWDKDGNLGMGKCLKCGCSSGKLWLGHEKCPIGKWDIEPLTPSPSV
jgi:hypothetical protein